MVGGLRRLLVRPDARALVDRRRDALGETGDEQPSAEQGRERDRGAGGGMRAPANDHEHQRRPRRARSARTCRKPSTGWITARWVASSPT